MLHRSFCLRLLSFIVIIGLPILIVAFPAHAAVDPYVTRYLKVAVGEPVSLNLDERNSREFTVDELSAGKASFEQNCLSCHVGGNTLPEPTVPLSLSMLQGATPRRDTINGLVAFLRHPMIYDGSEEAILCRQIPESWLSTPDVEKIAGFVLRAAQKAPAWGTETFQGV